VWVQKILDADKAPSEGESERIQMCGEKSSFRGGFRAKKAQFRSRSKAPQKYRLRVTLERWWRKIAHETFFSNETRVNPMSYSASITASELG
jgi:hypothetical protein